MHQTFLTLPPIFPMQLGVNIVFSQCCKYSTICIRSIILFEKLVFPVHFAHIYLHLSVRSPAPLLPRASLPPWGQTLEVLLLLTSEPPRGDGASVLVETCDMSILWRGESDSWRTYKRRCCQITRKPRGTVRGGFGGRGAVCVITRVQ